MTKMGSNLLLPVTRNTESKKEEMYQSQTAKVGSNINSTNIMMWTLLILSFLTIGTSADLTKPYQYISLKSDIGLYFEEIAEIRFYHEEWKLATYINLTCYEEEYTNLQKMVNTVKNLCIQLKTNNSTENRTEIFNITEGCGPIINEIDIIMLEIEEYNSRWFYNIKTINSRKKRGLINIIGEVSKALFGTLSESDSKEYLKEFEILHNKGAVREQIIRKQTTIIQSSVNLIQATAEQLEEKNKQLESQLNSIKYHIEKMSKQVFIIYDTMAAKTKIQDMVSFITLLIISFQNKQKQFLQAIAIGEKGANNPILIPPQMFMEELNKIRSAIIARDLDLPLEVNRDSITTFYQLASPQVRIISNQLIISFSIPLVTMTDFNIYKITSVPNRIQGNYFNFVVPTYEYVALDKYKINYITMTHDEMDNCHHIGGLKLACKQTSPIMTSHNTELCELKLLRNEGNLSDCNIRISNLTSEIWIKLRQPITWIYTFPKEETVHISCDNDVFNQQVIGTGILSIAMGCEIKTEHILIKGFRTSETIVYKKIIPSVKNAFNFNNTVSQFLNVEKFSMKNVIHPNIVNFGQKEKLQAISMGLNEIKALEESLQFAYSPAEVRNRMIWLSILILIIAVAVSTIVGRFAFRKTRTLRRDRKLRQLNHQIEVGIINMENTDNETQKAESE